MSTKKLPSLTLALLMAALATGCVRSTQPILLDDQVIVDNSLVGTWVDSDKSKAGTIVVGAPDKDNLYDIVYSDKGSKQIHVLARVGNIGDKLIAELRPVPMAEGSADASPLMLPLYSFVVVEKANDQLTLSTLDVDWMKQFIKEHPQELPTVIGDPNCVTLNAATDAVQDFLKKHLGDDGALKTKTIFVREPPAAK